MTVVQNFQPMTRAKMAQLSLPDIRAYAKVTSTRTTQSVAATLTASACLLGIQSARQCY
ncbi:hypothetical protein BDM02DRAFT_3109057 [Thelephora ganbajun]|uniref:Uncharacterized protein n=1 Tax=Thelephora ganbajun TaxID=370292 RepID=A0ACB6ZTS9_THEGA|nr:hypothetical protein BDM02DRAFT_3109057 [Thelephora ganbajun]